MGVIRTKRLFRKAQIAIEFMMILGLAMIIVLILVGVLYYLSYNYSEEKNINLLQDYGYSLQSELILASQVESGYERVMTVPPKVNHIVFDLNIVNNDLVIIYKGTEILFPIPATTGDFNPGTCTITNNINHEVDVSCS